MSDPLPNIEALCRLCLKKGEYKSVFDREESNQQVTFIIKIQDCVSIKINKDNDLPTVVCKDCENFINSWYIFKEKCGNAQITLKKWKGVKNNKEGDKSSENSNKSVGEAAANKKNENEVPIIIVDDTESIEDGCQGSKGSDTVISNDNTQGGGVVVNDSGNCEVSSHIENKLKEGITNELGDNSNLMKIRKDGEDDITAIKSNCNYDENIQDLTDTGNDKTDKNSNFVDVDDGRGTDGNVTSTVTTTSSSSSSSCTTTSLSLNNNNKENMENQSPCQSIKIASAVSLPKGFFERNFDDLNNKQDNDNMDNIIDISRENDEADDIAANKQLDNENNDKVINKVTDVNGSTAVTNVFDTPATVGNNQITVSDSTITSSKEQDPNIIKMVARIKTEPIDEPEISEGSISEIRIKTEPEELVEEHVVQNPEEEVDLAANKCTLCNYVFSSNNSLMRHLSSRKHIRRSLPPESLKMEMTRGDDLTSEILPENSVRSTRQKNKGYNNVETTYNDEDSQETYLEDSFFCKICNRTYCSASELKRHNRSMKHMRNLSIRAALKKKANRQMQEQQMLINSGHISQYGAAPPRILQKDYICPMEDCNFSCKEGSALLEHMMVHGIRNNGSVQPDNPMASSVVRESFAQSLQKIYCKCKQVFTNNSEYLYHLKLCRFMAKVPPQPQNMPSLMFEPPQPVVQIQQQPQQPQQQQQQQQQQDQQIKQICRLCDLTFTSNEIYLNHLEIYHKGSSLEQSQPKMKLPPMREKLWTQFISKSGEVLYNCVICNKKYKQHFSLNSHLKQHKQLPVRRDICKICNKVFSNSKFFEKHVRGHFLPPNSRKLFCFKCYKTFDHRGEIIAHRATCNSIKMKIYTCNTCKHSFKDMAALKEHKIRAHSSILPVQALCTVDIKEESETINTPIITENKVCPICNKSFYNFQNMKRHCLTVHRGEDISFLEYGPFTAYDEPSTSAALPQVSVVTQSQIGQDKWDCQFCKKQFRSEKLLIYHIEHHCPYLQHIPNTAPIEKPPVERHNHRCIICAKFLPAFQNSPDTVCARCMAKFEGKPLEEHVNRKAAQALKNMQLAAAKAAGGGLPSRNGAGVAVGRAGENQQVIVNKPLTQPVVPKGNFFQCPIGKKLFTTEAWMVKHYKNCDGTCPSYINCARCNLNFKSISMFEHHVPKCEAGTIKRFDCSICGKTYSKRDYVVKHKRYAHGKPMNNMNVNYSNWMQPIKVEDDLVNRRYQERPGMMEMQSGNQIDGEQDDEHEMDDEDLPSLQPEVTIEIVPTDGNIILPSDDVGGESGAVVVEPKVEPTYPCEGCSRVFNTHRGMINHSIVHMRYNLDANTTYYDCKFCKRNDLLQSQIYSHTHRCVKYALAVEPTVNCKQCHRNFNTSQQMKEFSANIISHVFDCYEIPYYKDEDDGGKNPRLLCYICCFAFSCPDNLRIHKAEHGKKSSKANAKKLKRKLRPEIYESDVVTVVNTDDGVDEGDTTTTAVVAADVNDADGDDAGDGDNDAETESIYDSEQQQQEQDEQSSELEPPRKICRDAKLYKCKICDRQFFSINKLKNHEKVHGIIQKNVYDDDVPNPPPDS